MRPEAYILTLLLKKPRSFEEIRRITRFKRSFLERALKIMEEQGLVVSENEQYSLTKLGKIIALNALAKQYLAQAMPQQ